MGLEKKVFVRSRIKSHPRLGKEEEFLPGVGRRSLFYFVHLNPVPEFFSPLAK